MRAEWNLHLLQVRPVYMLLVLLFLAVRWLTQRLGTDCRKSLDPCTPDFCMKQQGIWGRCQTSSDCGRLPSTLHLHGICWSRRSSSCWQTCLCCTPLADSGRWLKPSEAVLATGAELR